MLSFSLTRSRIRKRATRRGLLKTSRSVPFVRTVDLLTCVLAQTKDGRRSGVSQPLSTGRLAIYIYDFKTWRMVRYITAARRTFPRTKTAAGDNALQFVLIAASIDRVL